jgi:stage II sporulation protein D
MHTRRTSVGAGLGAALLATTLLTQGPASAARAPRITVPDTATITVDGHGYGHGHGLSQYGAEGAARQGLSAGRIVRFYYPGTTGGKAGGSVTVWISEDTDHDTTVVARRGLRVRDLGNGTTRSLPTTGAAGKATRWKLAGAGGGRTRVLYKTAAWHLWRTLRGNGEFRSTGPHLTLVLGGGRQVSYRGTLRSLGPVPGHPGRITVNKVSLEGYVQGVVPREMPASWHQSALRAQAIAARTYAAFEAHSSPLSSRAALCDTTSCQVYGGVSAEDARTNRAVAGTAGQVRLYGGEPAFTQFSASNGGWTSAAPASAGEPYLDAHVDPYDGWSGNAVHTWRTTVTSRQVERHWPGIGNLTSISIDQRDGHGEWNGRVLSMTLHGSTGDRTLSGEAFRAELGLRSSWFTLSIAS